MGLRCPHSRWRPAGTAPLASSRCLQSILCPNGGGGGGFSRTLGAGDAAVLAPTQPGLTFSLRPMSSTVQDEASKAAPVEAPGHSYQSLQVTSGPEHILHVQINWPEKRNAMNRAFWSEMVECFNKISEDASCRAVVVSGEGRTFTSGLVRSASGGSVSLNLCCPVSSSEDFILVFQRRHPRLRR
ncbi:delta(3,5)-Delta(2,4)-dienoyl-CoA isomerase, mitochondrial-like [Trichechus manatus latirostris]|uniref:Delta(3,5)-Delta(2,4)-dienoyl-CoA isomerase, mitochondrial-like n=1 Tax=Trichechus manatus latirostris TaxID=127582 RepID=A0A2Y9S144_TRIMA|nr:delta(3,5)-Delta(2,4)-dienoyl-CoA isomerase, mitochondrial-like [Trichechus manatus latirostris]